jgi:hypothetical protein
VPMTPGCVNCASDKPAYDSVNSAHALSSFFRSCCLSIIQRLQTSVDDTHGNDSKILSPFVLPAKPSRFQAVILNLSADQLGDCWLVAKLAP